jgi:hypothetical protein
LASVAMPIDDRYRMSESLATTEADFDPRVLTEAGYQLHASTIDRLRAEKMPPRAGTPSDRIFHTRALHAKR